MAGARQVGLRLCTEPAPTLRNKDLKSNFNERRPGMGMEMTMSTAIKDKLVSERLYDRKTCDVMSHAEAETLWRLHQEIGQTFDAVCDAYAIILGLEKLQLSDEQRANLIDKVEALMENYDIRSSKETAPSTQLTACLKRHHDLSLEILNIRDDISSRFDVDDL